VIEKNVQTRTECGRTEGAAKGWVGFWEKRWARAKECSELRTGSLLILSTWVPANPRKDWHQNCKAIRIQAITLSGLPLSSLTLGSFALSISSFLLFVFSVLGFELRAYTSNHSTSPFSEGFFWDRVSWIICPGWLQTMILLISASWVARITGESHRGWSSLSISNLVLLYMLHFSDCLSDLISLFVSLVSLSLPLTV
jgi:hypothetical protein